MTKLGWTWIALSACLTVAANPVRAVPGDLNRDGVVNFEDFFIFADNFGKTGEPETVRDTVTVEKVVERIVTHTIRDTVYTTLHETVYDTVYVPDQPARPPLRDSWTEVIQEIEKATYWLGYTARPQGGTRYDVTFVGTGFAVDERSILTNYHVGSIIDDQLKNVRADLEPVFIAVRAGSRIFGDHTYYLGTIDEDRNLLGFWHPGYDGTSQSPDLALFLGYDHGSGKFAGPLEFVRLASFDVAMAAQTGNEIGILGFPGPLETNHSPFNLTPTPTFRRGSISAVRAFDGNVSLTREWGRALMGMFIQHDLDTSPGNSGSPLFNRRAEVLGIHNSGISGGSALDFGIRADEIRRFMKALYVGAWDSSHVNAKPVAGMPYAVIPHQAPR